ncbi:MAG: hypothetical protein R6U27_04790 [Desulfobacterales bacterium]
MAQISAVIDFVSSNDKSQTALYYAKTNSGYRAVYHEFDINQKFEKILEYSYTLEIPSQAVIPNSIRLSYWKNCHGNNYCRPWSWNYPVAEGHFQVIRGIKHETTTPDAFSWSYYSYDLDRMLILSRYKDQNVFFSISKQQDKAPGKKAFTVGNDQDWNYLYTQEKGVNKTGLGWVTPYMYSSFAITVFVEQPDKSTVKCAMFKWLNAGAAGINMVRKHHIYEGIKRFETGFRSVLENPFLPEPEELATVFLQIDTLSKEELKEKIPGYFENLKARYHDDEVFQDNSLNEFFTGSDYLNQLSQEEMKSILRLEYMKTILRKDPIIQIGQIFPHLISLSETP